MSNTSYTLRITKALNGWIVESTGAGSVNINQYALGPDFDPPMLVKDGESLGDMIAAAVMSERMKSDQEILRLQQDALNKQMLQGSSIKNVGIGYYPNTISGAQTIASGAISTATVGSTYIADWVK
jgi:hypothetical protein